VVRSGTPVVGGTVAGRRDTIPVPSVRAAALRPRADFVLTAGGLLLRTDGSMVCDASMSPAACADAGLAWVFGGTAGWSIPDAAPPAGIYYAEADVTIAGSPGSAAAPVSLTVIAEGSISVTGAPVMVARAAGLLFVTDGDLLVTGAMRVDRSAQMLVREQAHVGGAAVLTGQLLVEDERRVSGLVTASVIDGSAAIAFDGAAGAVAFAVSGWRRVAAR
jgi:hypothetical protein